jgi:predicted GH43/DUF377 family glycosyl hydrolase
MLVERLPLKLAGNPKRVLTRIFLPGDEELIRGQSRVKEVIERVLVLPEDSVVATLTEVLGLFGDRHRDLIHQFETHFDAVAHLMEPQEFISDTRKYLIGAYCTMEYTFESTAYFNPSIVPHFDQSEAGDGELRIIMSVRTVGEGHISTLVFRTGMIGADGSVSIDKASDYASTRARRFTVLRPLLVEHAVREAGIDVTELKIVLGMMKETFTPEELHTALSLVKHPGSNDSTVNEIIRVIDALSLSSYEVDFSEETELAERVLWPTARDERRGIEDARFVEFTDNNGLVNYRGTYTGFDGTKVVSRLLETPDFRRFSSVALSGPASRNKGVALFPRPINGGYYALSRWDGERNYVSFSEDGYHWNSSVPLAVPLEPRTLGHVGNCGSPIETDEGWLVITHGTGPMRQYSIGALLLDLDDPTKVIATLKGPLLAPNAVERNGYVPNVVFSCGSMIHNGHLILPYGFGDYQIGFCRITVKDLIREIKTSGHPLALSA